MTDQITEAIYSRPEIQRTELGPIVNHMARTIFDTSEITEDLCRQQKYKVETVNDLSSFCLKLSVVLSEKIREAVEKPGIEKIFEQLNTYIVDRIGYIGRTTHYSMPDAILKEGIASGVVMPLQLYIARQLGYEDRYSDEVLYMPINSSDLLNTLEHNMQFLSSLLKLSHANNGMYGVSSSDSGLLHRYPFYNLIMLETDTPAHMFEDDGYHLSKKSEMLLKENRFIGSDGCPVRRASYPVLGPVALEYAERFGILPEELKLQGRSAIMSGCDFLARSLRKVLIHE